MAEAQGPVNDVLLFGALLHPAVFCPALGARSARIASLDLHLAGPATQRLAAAIEDLDYGYCPAEDELARISGSVAKDGLPEAR